MPLEPSPHLLGEVPDAFLVRALMEPMVERALIPISMSVNVSWELTMESRDHVVEGESIGGEMNPSGVGCEDGEGLPRPKTVVLVPGGDVGDVHLHIGAEVFDIEFPVEHSVLLLDVLLEDGAPLLALHILIDELDSLSHIRL